MNRKASKTLKGIARESINFFAPAKIQEKVYNRDLNHKLTAVVIPTYAPTMTTYKLIHSVLKFSPDTHIVVIDDCTPIIKANTDVLQQITALASANKNLTFIKTETNTL